MRIKSEHDSRAGHGRCHVNAPDVFDLEDERTVRLLHDPVAAYLAELAESGVQGCADAELSQRP